jgi:predicted phosphodiesterase
MRVAALYDVHGMVHALEAVLAEVDADAVLFGGDIVAGPFPVETWELVQTVPGARFVRGNAEREPDERELGKLDPAAIEEMRAWPATVELDGVLYCHGSPASDLDVITDATTDERLEQLLAGTDAGLVVGGHTHMQQRRGRYVNAGSVGMPYEGDVAAFWLVVTDGVFEFRKTAFDVERAIADIAASDWPAAREFVDENLRCAVSRAEATEILGG